MTFRNQVTRRHIFSDDRNEMNAREQLRAVKRAIKAGDIQMVERLLLENPELVVARGHGWTPLQDVAFQAKTAILKVMLAHGVGISAADIAHALARLRP